MNFPSFTKFILICTLFIYFQSTPNALAVEPRLPELIQEKLFVIESDPEFLRLKNRFSQYPIVQGMGKSRYVNELTPISERDADELIDFLSRYMPGSTFDGHCSFRNFFWQILLARLNIKTGTAVVYSSFQMLTPKAHISGAEVEWYFHIAPAVCINKKIGFCTKFAVLDPTLASQSLSLYEWRKIARGSTRFVNAGLYNPGVTNPEILHRTYYSYYTVADKRDNTWSEIDLANMAKILPRVKFNF